MKKIGLIFVGLLIVVAIFYISTKSGPPLAYIPNAGEGTISVIDTKKDEVVRTIKVDNQLSDGIEVSLDGKKIYAGNYDKGELFIINSDTGEVEKKIDTGVNLHGIDITPDGRYLYLASGDLKEGEQYNFIKVVDTKREEIIKEIKSPSKSPAHIDFSNDGSLAYVSNVMSNDISLIDTRKMEIISTIPVGTTPNELEPSKDDKYLFTANVTDGTISVVDIVEQKEIRTIKAGDGTHGLELSPDGKFLYAANRSSNDLIKFNLENYEITKKVITGDSANHVSYVPGINKLYVTNKDSNDLTVVDDESFEVIKKVELGKTPHEISFSNLTK
ncbi:cytochrome D1 domain-containing protein [Robertmurraya massiliosenegalensis]|uniref:cytochrome D1 domain-containing protein n=1 Tax=Robertmurraya TaxID=2837507 RepID=UPI0039A7739E